jgi:hypothetical protein
VELEGQISFSNTSVRLSLSQSCAPLVVVGRNTVQLEDVITISSYLAHPLTPSFYSCSEMFISCARDLMNLLGSLVMGLSRLVARTGSFKTLFLLVINVSEDPPEVIK